MIDAVGGADLILHCGDLDALGVLDHLETVAPVFAVRGYPDPREEGERRTTGLSRWAGFGLGWCTTSGCRVGWRSSRIRLSFLGGIRTT